MRYRNDHGSFWVYILGRFKPKMHENGGDGGSDQCFVLVKQLHGLFCTLCCLPSDDFKLGRTKMEHTLVGA